MWIETRSDLVEDHLPVKLASQALYIAFCNCNAWVALKTNTLNHLLTVNLVAIAADPRQTNGYFTRPHSIRQVGNISPGKRGRKPCDSLWKLVQLACKFAIKSTAAAYSHTGKTSIANCMLLACTLHRFNFKGIACSRYIGFIYGFSQPGGGEEMKP